jgi:hypothetical protein
MLENNWNGIEKIDHKWTLWIIHFLLLIIYFIQLEIKLIWYFYSLIFNFW